MRNMYIGEKKIKSKKDGLVKFEDGSEEKFSPAYAEYLTTKKAMPLEDFTKYRDHKVISDIMKLYVESGVTMADIVRISQGLNASLDNAQEQSFCITHGVDHSSHIKFKTINDIVLNKK